MAPLAPKRDDSGMKVFSPVPSIAQQQLTEVSVAQGSLAATFVAPADGKRHPAIVVLGGSEGGLHAEDARLLASHGYAALALAYFGVAPLPKELSAIPLETVTHGIDWLAARSEVDASRIGIEGGIPVAYIPSDAAADVTVGRAFQTGGAISFRDTYEASLAAAPAAVRERALIATERIAGPVLCIAGDADREWDSAGACRIIHERRHAAGRNANDAVAIEPGAGHALPFSGKSAPASFPAGPATIVLGGTPEANGRGGADAFARTLAFFDRVLTAR